MTRMYWSITINNPTSEDDLMIIDCLDEMDMLSWNYETAPTTGTLHYQVFVKFKTHKEFKQVQDRFPGHHIEAARKPDALQAYCEKTDNDEELIMRFGHKIVPAGNTINEAINHFCLLGYRWEEAVRENLKLMSYEARYNRWYKTIHKTSFRRTLEREVYWIHGRSGKGKTKWAADHAGTELVLARFSASGQLICDSDDITPDSVVLVDEFEFDGRQFTTLNVLMDHWYDNIADVKHGKVRWSPRRVYLCSIDCPSRFPVPQGHEITELMRRITHRIAL